MGTLLYFAVFAGFFFLMMRFGCGSHVMGHGHGGHADHGDHEGHGAGWKPPVTEVDPVCRMTVTTATAKSTVYKGRIYYFCSAEHRDQFEAAPDRYSDTMTGPEPKPVEHAHG